MAASQSSQSLLGNYLGLFASTEIFVFVFMEIVSKIETVQRVLFKSAELKDYIVFVVVFGLFSIFGTYIGIPGDYGSISNIRDIGPIVAGLAAGPYVGVATGLIGGLHRLTLGGNTAVPCALATILAGLLAGLVYQLNRKKLPGPVMAMLFGAGVEFFHAGLILAITRPFDVALTVVYDVIPEMIIAVSLGVGIAVIIFRDTIKSEKPVEMDED
jgi:sigma-B regulation protein RsbU (phosphoserine phosphatase)